MKKRLIEAERVGYIYTLINLLNGKEYVGQTVRGTLNRLKQHVYEAFGKKTNTPLYRAMRRDGMANFKVAELWRGPESKLNAAEKRFIRQRKTFINLGFGYNLTTGGGQFKMSLATRKKISRLRKKFFKDPVNLKQLSKIQLADWALPGAKERRKRTPAVEKIRRDNMVAALSKPRVKRRLSKSGKAAWAVEGRKERASATMKAVHAARPEIRKEVGKLLRGIKHTDAHNRLTAKAALAQWASEEGRAKLLEGLRRGAQRRWARDSERKRQAELTTRAWAENRDAYMRTRHVWTKEEKAAMSDLKSRQCSTESYRNKAAASIRAGKADKKRRVKEAT
jgi:group I intron endonuclease